MQYWALVLTALIYSLGCWVTYSDDAKQRWWYLPLGVSLGALVNLIWFYVCRVLPENNKIYVFNLMWDAVMVAVYYGLPLLFFGVKLDRVTMVGATLMLVGIFVMKLRL